MPRLHDERIVHAADGDGHLVFDLLQRSIADHLALPHDLHGVDLLLLLLLLLAIVAAVVSLVVAVRLALDLDDVAERAPADHVEYLEVGLGHLALDAELGHEERLVHVHRIVGLAVSVRIGERLGLVLAARRVAQRVALQARRQKRDR